MRDDHEVAPGMGGDAPLDPAATRRTTSTKLSPPGGALARGREPEAVADGIERADLGVALAVPSPKCCSMKSGSISGAGAGGRRPLSCSAIAAAVRLRPPSGDVSHTASSGSRAASP
jgi:hypothetical protein